MNKEYKNIDDLMRSEMDSSLPKVPATVKENIDQSLGFGKRKRIWPFFAILALVGVGAGIWGLWPDAPTKDIAMTTPVPVETVSTTLTSENEEPITVESWELINETPSPESATDHAVIPHTNRNAVTSTHESEAIHIASSSATSKPSTVSTNSPNQPATTQHTNTLIDNTPEAASSTLITPSISYTPATLIGGNEETTAESILNSVKPEETTPPTENASSPEESAVAEETPDKVVNPNTETEEDKEATNIASTEEESAEENDTTQITPEPEIDLTPEQPDRYRPWSIGLTAGINQVKTAYQAQTGAEQVYYTNSTKEQPGWQTNLDVSYRLKNGLFIGSGLGYTRFNEDFEYTIENLKLIAMDSLIYDYAYEYEYDYHLVAHIDSSEVVDSIAYIKDSTLFVTDSTLITYADTSYQTFKKAGRNSASYFSVPLHLGTQIAWRKFQFDLYASLRFNFLLNGSETRVVNNEIVTFDQTSQIYKPFYTDLLLATKVHYNLVKNLYVTGTVQFRPVMNSMYQNVTFDKTYHYTHFGLGLTLRL